LPAIVQVPVGLVQYFAGLYINYGGVHDSIVMSARTGPMAPNHLGTFKGQKKVVFVEKGEGHVEGTIPGSQLGKTSKAQTLEVNRAYRH
jgi:hypothetical protein